VRSFVLKKLYPPKGPARWEFGYRLALAGGIIVVIFMNIAAARWLGVAPLEAARWSAAVLLGGLGFWIGLCRGHWGQSIIGLNAGALLGLGSVFLAGLLAPLEKWPPPLYYGGGHWPHMNLFPYDDAGYVALLFCWTGACVLLGGLLGALGGSGRTIAPRAIKGLLSAGFFGFFLFPASLMFALVLTASFDDGAFVIGLIMSFIVLFILYALARLPFLFLVREMLPADVAGGRKPRGRRRRRKHRGTREEKELAKETAPGAEAARSNEGAAEEPGGGAPGPERSPDAPRRDGTAAREG